MTESSSYYPVFLDLRGRRCAVFGDSEVALEKARNLQAAGADVVHHVRPFRRGDLQGVFLAIEASGDTAAQTAVRHEADVLHVLLNVVDVAAKCDWIAPAVVRRGPLQVAISTSGESPFLAAMLRARLEAMLGEEWASFTGVVGTVRRRLRRRGVGQRRQLAVYRRLVASPIRRLLGEGRFTEATALAVSIEQSAHDGDAALGEVVLVGAGPGDAGLMTLAGAEALQLADTVLYDALVAASVLGMCPPQARLVDVGKRAGRDSTPQHEINEMLIRAARAGEMVIRLKGGDPLLFGRGGEEIDALVAAGIPVRVIPGVTSAVAAAAAAGVPLTQREVAASVAIVAGERAARAPAHLSQVAAAVDTLVVLMPHQLEAVVATLVSVLGEHRPALLVTSATLPGEHVLHAPLGRIAALAEESGATGPRTLIVGAVTDPVARAIASSASSPVAQH